MKDLEYYQGLKYPRTAIPLASGRYRVTYINLPGVMGEGDSLAEAEKNAESKRLEFTGIMLKKGLPISGPEMVTKIT